MAKAEKSITINAPVEKVFAFIDEHANIPQIWPSLVEVTDIKSLPNGGYSDRFVYKMAGIRLEGTSEAIEYVANQRTVTENKGGIEGTVTWTYETEDGGTKVTFEVEYTVPVPVLGKLAESLIVKLNEREAETLLANVKDRMEA